jgi:hypothetical protein
MSELPEDSDLVPASDEFKDNFWRESRISPSSAIYIVRANCWGIELRDRDEATGSVTRHILYDEQAALGLGFGQWMRRNPEKLLGMADEVHIHMFDVFTWKVVIETASGNVSFFRERREGE